MIDSAYIENILTRIPALEAELSDPATASNHNKFRRVMQEHAGLKRIEKKAQHLFSLQTRLAENRELAADESEPELAEMAKAELEEIEAELPGVEKDLRVSLLPPDPDDGRNAVIEIRAGTGGDEAALFAGDLFRMYNRYSDGAGWKVSVVDASASEVGGYKEVVFTVEGSEAYGILRYESGTHRVQRVPSTESQGRIHTSAATVAVFPEAEADDDIDIPDCDIRVDVYRASGPGGQCVNTTDSAVRITHIPTGVVAQSQDQKSQHRNREKAMGVLKARVLDQKRHDEAEKQGASRRSMIGSGDRSGRIRTYNFPQNRLTDHRIGLTLYSLDRVMEGDLGEIVKPLREHDLEERMKDELGS
ncbi:MAG: peptide chain release factor 1 [Verrucomicrobia bacterium]|nr:peptide chain release factor 1 [Verrucomicrobiota bacterium]